MDVIRYEQLEDWIKQSKAYVNKPVYLNALKTREKDSNRMTSTIIIQHIHEGILHECTITNGMPEVMIVPEWVFSVVSEKTAAMAMAEYHGVLNLFDTQVKDEYLKAEQILKTEGFTNIIMGMVIS